MHSPIATYLTESLTTVVSDTSGELANYIPEAVQAPTMGNLNGRGRSPTMAAAIPEMYYLCLRCPAASTPRRSPWNSASI